MSGRKYRQDAPYRKMKSHKKTAQNLRGFSIKLLRKKLLSASGGVPFAFKHELEFM